MGLAEWVPGAVRAARRDGTIASRGAASAKLDSRNVPTFSRIPAAPARDRLFSSQPESGARGMRPELVMVFVPCLLNAYRRAPASLTCSKHLLGQGHRQSMAWVACPLIGIEPADHRTRIVVANRSRSYLSHASALSGLTTLSAIHRRPQTSVTRPSTRWPSPARPTGTGVRHAPEPL